MIHLIDTLGEDQLLISEKLKGSLLSYQKVISGILRQEDIAIGDKTQSIKGYAQYALREGTTREKAELMRGLHIPLILKDRHVQRVS